MKTSSSQKKAKLLGKLKEIKKRARAWLCKKSKRYKLRAICKATGIKPRKWQIDYVLGKTRPGFTSKGRCNGKTETVLLQVLMGERASCLMEDPDFGISRDVLSFYISYLREYQEKCLNFGIPVSVDFREVEDTYDYVTIKKRTGEDTYIGSRMIWAIKTFINVYRKTGLLYGSLDLQEANKICEAYIGRFE